MKAYKKIIKQKNFSQQTRGLRFLQERNSYRWSDGFILLEVQNLEVLPVNDFFLPAWYIQTIKSFDSIEDKEEKVKVLSGGLWYELEKMEDITFQLQHNVKIRQEKTLFWSITNTGSMKTYFEMVEILWIQNSEFKKDMLTWTKTCDHYKVTIAVACREEDAENFI